MIDVTDFNVGSLSQEQLDAYALQGGVVGVLTEDSEKGRAPQPEDHHGYGFRWIGTKPQEPRSGMLIMTPRSDRAQEFLRRGKVAIYMDRYDLDRATADSLYQAAKKVKFGFEDGVLEYAVRTRHNKAWKVYPGLGKGVWGWVNRWGMTNHDLSAPRLDAVYNIIQTWELQVPAAENDAS